MALGHSNHLCHLDPVHRAKLHGYRQIVTLDADQGLHLVIATLRFA
jgi:hypothetical protein